MTGRVDSARSSPGNTATIRVIDVNGAEISLTQVPDAFAVINVARNAGESLIGSVVIAVAAGEIVIDALSFGYPATGSTDDIACVIATNNEFVCVVSDPANGDLIAGANGTITVNGSQVTGTGNFYAAPGETLVDGSTIAPLTISAGTVAESATLDFTAGITGLSIAVSSAYNTSFDRGADLATVAAVYTDFDIYGEMSSFDIDAAGVITGQTASACVLSGQVSVIDATANAYDVNLIADVATCAGLGGSYDGLGMSQDENDVDDLFIFAVFVDGQLMIVAEAIK